MSEPSALSPVRVWDLPTRLFHWSLAATVTGSLACAWTDAMTWHVRLGFVALMLLAFRLLWGMVGGRWSRFASFVYAPATLLRYLRGQSRPEEQLDVGHTPTGALSVFGLLLILVVQVGTGLVADDEIAFIGPLNRFVASETALSATSWHKTYGQWIIVAMVLLHLAAIAWYRLKKRIDLIRPMLDGDKQLPADTPPSADGGPQRVLALVLLLVCGALAGWVWGLSG
ncbi:MAG: cytochrome b/b6 domain-containing protein [Rubrivivax sp.]|nr:cytochrome b/b6 domain-containing protein [Rubrivivax sp.]